MSKKTAARQALNAHLKEHGCGCPGRTEAQRHFCENPEGHERNGGHAIAGFGHCPTAKALWDLLPPEEQVLLG